MGKEMPLGQVASGLMVSGTIEVCRYSQWLSPLREGKKSC